MAQREKCKDTEKGLPGKHKKGQEFGGSCVGSLGATALSSNFPYVQNLFSAASSLQFFRGLEAVIRLEEHFNIYLITA